MEISLFRFDLFGLHPRDICRNTKHLFFLLGKKKCHECRIITSSTSYTFDDLDIKRNVNVDFVPGFDKLSGFMMIIGILLTMMWILDRTHFFVFASMPFSTVLIILIGGILVIRYSLKKILS